MEQTPKQEPNLNDVGTRYQHLCDYRDALEICMKVLQDRGLNSQIDKQRFVKLTVALEVVSTTIDAYSGLFDEHTSFSLYKQVDSIPKNPDDIMPSRGTPLNDSNPWKHSN